MTSRRATGEEYGRYPEGHSRGAERLLVGAGKQCEERDAGRDQGPYFAWGDWAGMMLLGMALYKNGFLSGKWSAKAYVYAVIGAGDLVAADCRGRV